MRSITNHESRNSTKAIHRPCRYDFFTIWGNGLGQVDQVLRILRQEESLELIRLERRRVRDMEKFVFGLYGCDTVPLKHLESKLGYLFKVRPEILIVFARNLAPQEVLVGTGPFRKVQCQYINRVKWRIREAYNPREGGVRTEEHVIHASDYEEQVDYFLKMLGYKAGIMYLHGDSDGLPFRLPYHIKRPHSYIFKTVAIGDLCAAILTGESQVETGPGKRFVPIDKTPHYRSLRNGCSAYVEYVERYRYIWLMDDHYPEKLLEMNNLETDQVRSFDPIFVIRQGTAYRILDGVHRAAVSLNRGMATMKCVEFQY